MGDESAVEVADDFRRELEQLSADFEVEVIKGIGDAVMVRAANAGSSIRFGVHIVDQVGDRHNFPTVRVGMHTGSAIERAGDWFGGAVNLAARVSGEASGREVLLTDSTRDAAGQVDGIDIRDRGRRTLRNVAEPVSLFVAVREGNPGEAGVPIGPVCRMVVDPDHSGGQLTYEGSVYHFCSMECAARFARTPSAYAGSAGSGAVND